MVRLHLMEHRIHCPRCGARMELRAAVPRRSHLEESWVCPTCKAPVRVRRWANSSVDALWFERRQERG